MKILRLGIGLFALGFSAWAADDVDSRTAKVMDKADAESQVSALTITNVDVRFGFDKADDHDRVVVPTRNIELAIPLRAISHIEQSGSTNWLVKYVTTEGDAMVSGGFSEAAGLAGNSEFGSFSLPLVRLKRLDFLQPGTAAKPAKRPNVYDQDGRLRAGVFDAVLTLTDGTKLPCAQLRRNQVSAENLNDPMLVARPSFAIVCTNYTDLRLIRGETLQTVPFENLKSAEFLPNDDVIVMARTGADARMKLFRPAEETLEGFTGSSSKGDFYVALKFVRLITFGADVK